MRRAFVTGAGGFLGGHVLRTLGASGVSVRALVRSPVSIERLRASGVDVVEGDLRDAKSLAAALRPAPDVIFHVAADTSLWRRRAAAQQRTNVEGTRTLLQIARRAGVKRFVYTSSVAVYGQVGQQAIFEALPRGALREPNAYARSKAQAEKLVLEAAGCGDIEAVVLQPAHILGPGDRRNWARLALLIDQGRLPGVPPGIGCFADVRAVARAHVAAAACGASGECYLLGGVQASFLELATLIARELRRPPPRRTLPRGLLMAHAWFGEALALVGGREPQVSRDGVAIACQRLQVDDRKAVAALGYHHTPLPALVRDTVVWLRTQGLLQPT